MPFHQAVDSRLPYKSLGYLGRTSLEPVPQSADDGKEAADRFVCVRVSNVHDYMDFNKGIYKLSD